jgi:transcriptional regulator with XRE-family HTH domain
MQALNLIGQNLAKYRIQRGWSQQDLAEKLQLDGLDVSRDSVANMEARRQRVSDTQVFHLARVLQVSIADLFPLVPHRKNRFAAVSN